MAARPPRQSTIDRKPAFEASLLKFATRDPAVMVKLVHFIESKMARPPIPLSKGMRDHSLNPPLNLYRECHLAGDACLIYTDSGGVVMLLEIVNHDEMMGPKVRALAKRLKQATR